MGHHHGGKARAALKGHEGGVTSAVAFSPDGKIVAQRRRGQAVRLWDVDKGVERAVLKGRNDEVSAVTFSPRQAGPW